MQRLVLQELGEFELTTFEKMVKLRVLRRSFYLLTINYPFPPLISTKFTILMELLQGKSVVYAGPGNYIILIPFLGVVTGSTGASTSAGESAGARPVTQTQPEA
jgi:hypothetical protein